MNNLLTNRQYHVEGTWYAPQEFLQSFKSVARVEYTEQTSSAGDWTGYFLQKRLNTYHIILFWQTNSFPASGFDITTDSHPYFSFIGEEPTKEEIDDILWNLQNC